MKKFTLAILAIVMGFALTSCDKTSAADAIYKAANEFFTQAEANLQNIGSAEDFLNYIASFEEEKDDFSVNLFTPYIDDEGNLKGITEEEYNELEEKLYDRATAYNEKEADKAAEFLEPIIAQYETAVDAFYNAVFVDEDDDAAENAVETLDGIVSDLESFADYDNVKLELQQRYQDAQNKLDEIITSILGE